MSLPEGTPGNRKVSRVDDLLIDELDSVVVLCICRERRLVPTLIINIAKGTTDPRVEFISQDHSTQFTDILNILQFQNLG